MVISAGHGESEMKKSTPTRTNGRAAKRSSTSDELREAYSRGAEILRELSRLQTSDRQQKLSFRAGSPLRRYVEEYAANRNLPWKSVQADVQLAFAVDAITASCGSRWQETLFNGRFSPDHIRELSGKHPDRQRFVVAAVAAGCPLNAKPLVGLPTFETVGWHEVPDRLSRAKGQLQKAARRMLSSRVSDRDRDPDELISQFAQCGDVSSRTATLLSQTAPGCSRRRRSKAQNQARRTNVRRRKQVQTLRQMVGSARGLIEKNLRDIPRLARECGIDQDHAEESLFLSVSIVEVVDEVMSMLGIRRSHFASGTDRLPADRRVATHRSPDVDAIVACWLVERYLFAGEPTEVVFVPRDFAITEDISYDCVVDVGRTHDPHRRLFDHKPPGIEDRHSTCAAKLVWDHLQEQGCPADHLPALIELVWDGDSSRRRRGSKLYQESRSGGLHAEFHRLREGSTDAMLYASIKHWLNLNMPRGFGL